MRACESVCVCVCAREMERTNEWFIELDHLHVPRCEVRNEGSSGIHIEKHNHSQNCL